MFLCIFVESVKLTQHEFYKLYYDPYICFNDIAFDDFNAIETLTNDVFPISQFSNLNGGEDVVYLAFSFVGHMYPIYQHDLSSIRKL